MSDRITFTMTDGTVREFKHKGRPGGSYTVRLTFEEGFAVVTDEWGNRTIFPSHLILNIEDIPGRY